jgi:hypothetical protein
VSTHKRWWSFEELQENLTMIGVDSDLACALSKSDGLMPYNDAHDPHHG